MEPSHWLADIEKSPGVREVSGREWEAFVGPARGPESAPPVLEGIYPSAGHTKKEDIFLPFSIRKLNFKNGPAALDALNM